MLVMPQSAFRDGLDHDAAMSTTERTETNLSVLDDDGEIISASQASVHTCGMSPWEVSK